MATVAIEAFLGALLASAALAKLRDLSTFRRAVAHFDIVPSAAAPAIAVTVCGAELIVGGMLLVGVLPTVAASLAAALFAAFIVATTVNLLRGHSQVTCGCWGDESEPLSWTHVGVNGLLLALAVTAAAMLAAQSAAQGPAWWIERWTSAVGVTLVLFGVHMAVAFHIVRHWRRLARIIADRMPAGVVP